MLKRLSRCWQPFVRRIWCSVAIAHAKELMSYFKSLVLLRKLVVSPYRCNEFSAKSTFLTRPIPTSADRPDLRLVGLDISRPVPTENLLVGIYPDRSRPRIFWSGYIPTSPDLGQNYSGLVYVEHCSRQGEEIPKAIQAEVMPLQVMSSNLERWLSWLQALEATQIQSQTLIQNTGMLPKSPISDYLWRARQSESRLKSTNETIRRRRSSICIPLKKERHLWNQSRYPEGRVENLQIIIGTTRQLDTPCTMPV